MGLPYFGLSKTGFLQEISNRFGEIKLAQRYKYGEDIFWSKHISSLAAWNDIGFLAKVTDRTVFPCEIVLDLDPEDGETAEETRERFDKICDELDQRKLSYQAFFSGSRGYHIHMIFPDLLNFSRHMRERIREKFIRHFGCDLHKKSESMMILLEFERNPKTGKRKTFERGDAIW